jgi:hypothetical protein
MTIPARWWAPDRPTVAPDAVVLALLEPDGDDAANDLAATLLGVHRAGAAACESIAKGALPSHQGLSEALLASAAIIHDKFLTAVAKSSQPEYATLLVRDVLADADIAALDLYDRCVAKGITPSVAASRAGAVYGVPNRHISRYAAVASDPKSSPQLVSDLADRTLLEFVSKVVAVETADQTVEISKAPSGGGAAQQWDPRDHPRSKDSGEFVSAAERAERLTQRVSRPEETMSPIERLRARLGIGRGPERVGEETFEEPPERATRERRQPVQRQRREVRQTRERRGAAPAAAEPAHLEVTRAAAERTRAPIAAVARTRDQSAAQRQRIASFNEGTAGSVPFIPFGGGSGGNVPNVNLLTPLSDDGGPYEEHYEPMSFVLPQTTAMALQAHMAGRGTHDAPRLFRVGHLVAAAGDPVTLSGQNHETEFVSHMAQAVVHAHDDLDMDFAAPIERPVRIRDEDSAAPILSFERSRLTGNDINEDQHVWMGANYEQPDQDVLVYMQPSADPDYDRDDRPIPTVVEYRVTRRTARMRDEGSPKRPSWKLDPNQVYRISSSQPDIYWSPVHQVRVLVYQLDALDDDELLAYVPNGIEKALDPAEAAAFERRVRRNEQGEFAPTNTPSQPTVGARMERLTRRVRRPEEVETVETPAVARLRPRSREVRQRREQRVRREPKLERVLPPAKEAAPREAATRQREVAPAKRTRLQQAMERTRRAPSKAQRALILDDHQHYQVLTPLQFRAVTSNGYKSDGTIDVYGTGPMQALHRFQFHDVESAVHQMGVNLQEMVEANEGPISFGYRTNRRPLFRVASLSSQDADIDLAQRIRSTFMNNPDIAQIYVEYRDAGAQVYANERPVQDQVVIEFDESVDVTAPMTLVPIGRYHTGEMLYRDRHTPGGEREVGYGADNPFNAPIMRYRAEQAEPASYDPGTRRWGPEFRQP